MSTQTNEDLVITDGTGKSISGTDITNISAILFANDLTISFRTTTNQSLTVVIADEPSGAIQDPTPPPGETQFQIKSDSSQPSKTKHSVTFPDMGSEKGKMIFVWTETTQYPDGRTTVTDRGTEVPVQDGDGDPIVKE